MAMSFSGTFGPPTLAASSTVITGKESDLMRITAASLPGKTTEPSRT